jgi:hypothetical protein
LVEFVEFERAFLISGIPLGSLGWIPVSISLSMYFVVSNPLVPAVSTLPLVISLPGWAWMPRLGLGLGGKFSWRLINGERERLLVDEVLGHHECPASIMSELAGVRGSRIGC